MINIENDNFESVNTNAKRAKITDCMENETEQLGPGTSGFNKKPCLKNDLAMMLDSSSEDESQDEPENSSVEAVLKKELLAYRTKKRINVSENPLNWWSVHRGEFKVPHDEDDAAMDEVLDLAHEFL
ncbi:unnamed protein product [Danaus chrysippus]|uniref:(African queen) hypothetical protein n=1 Tax=Danaus chrysippus TaxID=151541 RepID=A0A8J2QS65_9NEOP|nr:unnamed protein product [Danaus chrysippus]